MRFSEGDQFRNKNKEKNALKTGNDETKLIASSHNKGLA